MGLDSAATAKKIEDRTKNFVNSYPDSYSREVIDVIQDALDTGFQEAEPSAKNFNIKPPSGTLMINMLTNNRMAIEIGRACAVYWAQAIGIGRPEICKDLVVSVVNDATKIASSIATELQALADQTSREPPYLDFVDVIYNNIKKIKWTIAEADVNGRCSSTSFGTVS